MTKNQYIACAIVLAIMLALLLNAEFTGKQLLQTMDYDPQIHVNYHYGVWFDNEHNITGYSLAEEDSIITK